MSIGDKIRSVFGERAVRISVHVMIRGRIGDGWIDVDQRLRVPEGTTLEQFIELAEKKAIPMREAIENSPHLRHTLMWNGERCPVGEHAQSVLADGDQLYLLSPLAGG